jgi:hypothetical protein
MSYILVGSPDKISFPAFIRFMRPYYNGYEIGEMHSLMSEESINLYVLDFISKFPDGIFSYFAKGAVNKDPMICLPKAAFEKANAVIWFDLYSNDPKVLKEDKSDEKLSAVIEEWKRYIQKIS